MIRNCTSLFTYGRLWLFAWVLLSTYGQALSQIQVNFPVSRIVFQRNNANQASVPFRAVLTTTVTKVNVRLVVRQGGTTTNWVSLTPASDTVSGMIPAVQGGWYDLEAEAFNGTSSLGTQRIQKIGVGEVLLFAGQSNAQGAPYTTGAVDDRVSCVNYYDGQITEYRFPLTFSQLSGSVNVGPTNNNYIYGLLGDKLVQRLGVPVLIYGAALGGTSSLQWRLTAQGVLNLPTNLQWDGADDLRPYRAIKSTLNHYVRRTGLRAICWHQGESDNGLSASDYMDNIQNLITASRQDAGNATLPWMIARVSWYNGFPDNNIVNAQNQLIAQVANCYAGPNTDTFDNSYRLDGTHFQSAYYPLVAESWNQALNDAFFQQSPPLTLSALPPRITVGLPQPAYQYAGGHSVIPFLDEAMSSTTAASTIYTAKLLTSSGQFITNLGAARTRPLRVTLPDNLTAGNYSVQVVSSGQAASSLSPYLSVFVPPYGKGTGTGLNGQYNSGSDGSGPLFLQQVDGPIDFTWFDASPTPMMPLRDYVVSWTGQVEAPVTGTYTIKCTYDDGARVWINNQLIIDEWGDHAWPFSQTGQISLQANQRYAIRVDFRQAWYNAQIRLQWIVPGVTNQAVYIPKDRLYPSSTTTTSSGTAIQVVFPTPRTVIQRDANNSAQVTVTGSCPSQTSRVEIRASPVAAGSGQNNDQYTVLDSQPVSGVFSGSISLTGGWYNLDIQAIANNKVISHTRLTPVGVGEVFVVAGESNAQGTLPLRSVASANDDRVSFSTHTNYTDTLRLPLSPHFANLTASKNPGPHGNSSWFWSELGDLLTSQWNVPVLFYNAAWPGSTIRNWRESMEQGTTLGQDGNALPAGMPYGNLKRILKDYVPLTGARAILWQQGESEYYGSDPQATNYATNLKAIIDKSRTHAGFAQLPWVIARSSADNTTRQLYASGSYEPVTNQQNLVIQTTGQTLAGPLVDTIQMPRPGGSTFQGTGLTRLANAWNATLTNTLWSMTPRTGQPFSFTDLRLTGEVAKRVNQVGSAVPFRITVVNEGTKNATNVKVRCTLPSQLSFTGSSYFRQVQRTLLATVPLLYPGQQQTLSFTAQPLQAGSYRLATEIVQADQLDPDSRPNTSFSDGEDDMLWLDFRTADNATAVFTVTPSVNAPPQPTVMSAQPIPDPNKIDLSLSMVSSRLTSQINSPISVSLIARNEGSQTAQSVQIGALLPTGLSFVSSSNMSLAGGIIRGTLASIPAGGQGVLSFIINPSAVGAPILRAQIELATPTDADSTPNNGYTNGEDDTCSLTFRILNAP